MAKLAQVLGLLLCVLLAISYAQRGKNTLVLSDNLSIRNTHSLFFQSLADRGYNLDFKSISDNKAKLHEHGEYLYDSVIVFATSEEDWADNVNVKSIVEYIDSGVGDVLIAGSSDVSDNFIELAKEVGAEFGENGQFVIDHLHYDSSDFDGEHTLIAATNFVNSGVLGEAKIAPVLYRGNGFKLSKKNTLVFPILSGFSSSFTHAPSGIADGVKSAGTNLVLVAGLQARNNARVVISGSIELFSDRFISANVQSAQSKTAQQSGNGNFVAELTKWNFGERGLLRIKSVYHHKLGETEQLTMYTVNDTIVYTVNVEEFNGNEWVPYSADDLQLEAQMLDPYIRTNLISDGKGAFTTTFVAPDVYGVYTFKLDYHKVGYSSLSSRQLVTIRPYRHDQYERFIASAFPYYASAFSMMGGVVVFSFLFLFSK